MGSFRKIYRGKPIFSDISGTNGPFGQKRAIYKVFLVQISTKSLMISAE